MKVCTKCKVEKDDSEFYKDKKSKNNLSYWCKKCSRECSNSHYKANSEKVKNAYKKYRKSEKYKEWHKKHRQTEKYKEYQKIYMKKYCQCETFKKTQDMYHKSEKGKIIRLKKYLGLKGVPTNQIPPELLELKRIQLEIKRKLKKGGQNEKTN